MGCQTLRPSSAIRNQSLGLTCLCKGKKKKKRKVSKRDRATENRKYIFLSKI